jgi:hypothetical protein
MLELGKGCGMFSEKPEEMRLLWKYGVMLTEIGCKGMGWIQLAQDEV